MTGTRRTSAGVGAAALAAGLLAAPTPALADHGDDAALRLVAASPHVTVQQFPGEPLPLDLGVHVVAGASALEIRASRNSYRRPIRASFSGLVDGRRGQVPLPRGLVRDFSGLTDFLEVTVRDAAGRVVLRQDQDWCPNSYAATRAHPDAPSRNPYPYSCAANPFTLGAVWGLPEGWSSPAVDVGWWDGGPVEEGVSLPDGEYRATVRIAAPYRRAFGIPDSAASATTRLTVQTAEVPEDPGWFSAAAHPGAATAAGAAPAAGPAPSPPRGPAQVPPGPKPDLRSLPAWGIALVSGGDEPGEPPGEGPGEGPVWGPGGEPPVEPLPQGDHLVFAATVWNAGPSPLVVDGFRQPGEDVMDAYQYFHDTQGQQVGYARAGTFEWDERDGHDHWHFTDFASYRLLDARRRLVLRSDKEAFCLANTDAVDYTVPGANWRPDGTDLHTACGARTALAVRQVLDVGSGDTYYQSLPGQSFDVTDLPNGRYWIEVVANPDGRLHESRTRNNRSLREVVLGGTPGARELTVPAVGGIDGSTPATPQG